MKIPANPPTQDSIFDDLLHSDNGEVLIKILSGKTPLDDKGRYLHWDKLRHLQPIEEFTNEQWWLCIKNYREKLYKKLPLFDKAEKPFVFCMPDSILSQLHWLDRHASGSIKAEEAITNPQMRNTYLIRSLVEEAINSSQLEGASTTRQEAREMIRQQRSPRDKSEQMILNNYYAMQFIHDNREEDLTPSMIFELQRIVTEKTLDDEGMSGRFRTENDDIHVVDNRTQKNLHTPPAASELPQRLKKICDFANSDQKDDDSFLHPVIKAIILHFMLAYDHPFCDGNGRTSRALFYWLMAKQGYWLLEFVSISRVIKEAPIQYGRAFLYTETDDNDVTYFLLHQLDVIQRAIKGLHTYLDRKTQDISTTEKLLQQNSKLKGKLNFRQLALLRHALKHPRFTYIIQEHQQSHGVSYEVARKDLTQLSDEMGLLLKTRQGRKFFFVVPNDFEDRINNKEEL